MAGTRTTARHRSISTTSPLPLPAPSRCANIRRPQSTPPHRPPPLAARWSHHSTSVRGFSNLRQRLPSNSPRTSTAPPPRHSMLFLHLARFCGHGLVSNGAQLGCRVPRCRSKTNSELVSSAKGVNWVKRSLTVLCRRPGQATKPRPHPSHLKTNTKTKWLTVSQWHRPNETLIKSENSDRMVSLLLLRKLQLERPEGSH